MSKKEAIYASNFMLDSWVNSLNAAVSLQEKFEKKPLQAFENQKEWAHSVRDRLFQAENESKKMTTEWKISAQNAVSKNEQEPGEGSYAKWADQLEEIGHKTQTIVFSSGRNSLELFSKSQAQLEAAYKQALEQQQQSRIDYLQVVEEWAGQIKQTQKNVLKSFGLAN